MVLEPGEGGRGRGDLQQMGPRLRRRRRDLTDDRFVIMHQGDCKADLPLRRAVGRSAGLRPALGTRPPPPTRSNDVAQVDPIDALKALIGSPNSRSQRWVWEQYDHMVMADTVRAPGGDAGVVRVHGTNKALAFTSDVTPRYVKADPVEGGKQAVAEAWRNLTAVGREAAGDDRQPQLRQSRTARDHGPVRRRDRRHRRGLSPRSTCRSSPATSRSTTRPTG